jgi:hypothetical protein
MFRFLRKTLLTILFAAFASQASAMFIQPDWLDPTAPGVGTNRYSYSFNDPINLRDPGGNVAVADDIMIGGAILGIISAEMISDLWNDGK